MLCHYAGPLYLVREAISLARLGSDHRSFEFVLLCGISFVYLVENALHKILSNCRAYCVSCDERVLCFLTGQLTHFIDVT